MVLLDWIKWKKCTIIVFSFAVFLGIDYIFLTVMIIDPTSSSWYEYGYDPAAALLRSSNTNGKNKKNIGNKKKDDLMIPFGKEYCIGGSMYNNLKYLAVGGMYHTGTNALYYLLSQNCLSKYQLKKDIEFHTKHSNLTKYLQNIEYFDYLNSNSNSNKLNVTIDMILKYINESHFENILWKLPFGKHKMGYSNSDISRLSKQISAANGVNSKNKFRMWDRIYTVNDFLSTLHIIIIKDPLTWFQSLCKEPYGIRFNHYKYGREKNYTMEYSKHYKLYKHIYCPANISTIVNYSTIQEFIFKHKQRYGRQWFEPHFKNNTNNNNYREYFSSLRWYGLFYNSLAQFWNHYYLSWTRLNNSKTVDNRVPHPHEIRDLSIQEVIALGVKNYNTVISIDNKYKIDKDNPLTDVEYIQYTDLFKLNEKQANIMKQIGHPLVDIDRTIPTIVIRFEDILYKPQQIVNFFCNCIGGLKKKDVYVNNQSAKPHGNSRSRIQALETYNDSDFRYLAYSKQDIQFLKENLDANLLNLFGYQID